MEAGKSLCGLVSILLQLTKGIIVLRKYIR